MVAEFSFKILTYLGLWKPQTLRSKWSKCIYNICTIFMLLFEHFYAFSFIITLFQNYHKTEILLQNLFLCSSIFIITFKVTYLNVYREEIISFTNMFLDDKCFPRNKNEMEICKIRMNRER